MGGWLVLSGRDVMRGEGGFGVRVFFNLEVVLYGRWFGEAINTVGWKKDHHRGRTIRAKSKSRILDSSSLTCDRKLRAFYLCQNIYLKTTSLKI
jgi:hypothetical protein